MNFFIIENAQKVNNFSVSTYIHTYMYEEIKKYILWDRWLWMEHAQ